MSDSLRPCGLKPTRLLCPWDSPGKNSGVGCHFLLQGIFSTQGSNAGLQHCRQTLKPLSHQEEPAKASQGILNKRKVRATRRCLLALSWSQLPWVGPPSTEAARSQILKRLDSTRWAEHLKRGGGQATLDPNNKRSQAKSSSPTVPDPGLLSSRAFSHSETTQMTCQLVTQLNLQFKKTNVTPSANRVSSYSPVLVRGNQQDCITSLDPRKPNNLSSLLTHHSDPRKLKHEESNSP